MFDSDAVQRVLKGSVGAPGIAVGLAYAIDRGRLKVPMRMVMPETVLLERNRFQDAIRESRTQLTAALSRDLAKEHRQILDAHLAWIDDEYMSGEVMRLIESEHINAEWAVKKLFDALKGSLSSEDEKSREERAHLFDEVCQRVMRNLMGVNQESLEALPWGVILVAHNISPGDMALVDRKRVLGMAIDIGGTTSHTCILARGMELPTVVGLDHVASVIRAGDVVILDATEGQVIVNPAFETVERYQEKARRIADEERELLKIKDLPVVTRDGTFIRLMANLELADEVDLMFRHGIRDVGLFRSEFVFLARGGTATEEEQYAIYAEILRKVGPEHVVTIRTLDLGWDKVYAQMEAAPESNPAMGLRAIRFCLRREDIFKDQLRALLRASVHGQLRIMFPMISDLSEIQRAKGILEEVRQELELESIEYSDTVKIGIMIEVPSAVITADVLAREVDFFSIGTNDLIQYALAVDRGNENVAHLYNPLHVAVLRLIRATVRAGEEAGIELSMCGEMAGDIQMTMLLLGLGVRNFSANPAAALHVKRLIRMIDLAEARKFADSVMAMTSSKEISRFFHSELAGKFPEIFKEYPWPV